MGGKGEGKKKTDKRTRPSSSTCDELEEDGRHFEELLTLYKALEQKDEEKSVHIAGLQAEKIRNLEKTLNTWKKRNLTLYGKST